MFAIRNFKFLGFALGRNGKGIYVRVHPKSRKKFKSRLKELSSRKRCQSIKPNLEKIKVYARGWLNYYGIAKDRWRQVLNEADCIETKYLFTLQQGISKNQLREMKHTKTAYFVLSFHSLALSLQPR